MADQRRLIFTADAKFSVVKAEAGKPAMLRGYAMVWNVLSTDRGGFKVSLRPGSPAFQNPTFALWHHDFSKPLGDTASGTLRIATDDTGVAVEIDLPDTSYARDAQELVESKRVRGMSFSMCGSPDFEESSQNGQVIFTVKSFSCDEVTITPIPAFDQTSIAVAQDDPDPNYAVRRAESLRFARYQHDFYGLLKPAA